jgi:photosystem II stability/assembly factor-like uncharacterized protein
MAKPKKGDTVVIVGTRKGLFLLSSKDRRTWQSSGPFFEGDTVRHAILDPRDGKTIYAAVTSEHWGAVVARSTDFGATWKHGDEGPRFSKESGLSVTRIWQIQAGEDGDLYAGTEPAGLFRSTDRGETWASVDALNYFPGRDKWPPGGGGLGLHTILTYPGEPKRMLIGISSAGIFGTGDGGASWRNMDGGIRSFVEGETNKETDSTCVHKMARDAKDPAIVYQQNHIGVYRRARGEDAWTRIEKGLPLNRASKAPFGFPLVAHPHDRGTAYVAPLVGDWNRVMPGGAMAVYRTTNGGKSWGKLTKGLPQKDAWFTVLRDGMRSDANDPAGIYVGTTTGQVYGSRDDGDSWKLLADHLPQVQCVETGIVGGA